MRDVYQENGVARICHHILSLWFHKITFPETSNTVMERKHKISRQQGHFGITPCCDGLVLRAMARGL